jgi:site-specific DNA recombinase
MMLRRQKIRAGLYARVSGELQVKENTIASQLDLLTTAITAEDLPLEDDLCFIDDGYSGDTLVRPALERLRDLAALGAFDRLYVECPDRLAREFAYQVLLLDELRQNGIEVIFLKLKPDPSPEGQLLEQVQGVMAQYERAKILERTRRGRLFAARSGSVSVLANAPYGYHYVSKAEGNGRATYVIRLEEATILRQVFEWVGREGLSITQVCKRLKERGVLTRHGKRTWDRATVLGMLKNSAYQGIALYNQTRSTPRKPRLRPRRGCSEFPRRNKVLVANKPTEHIAIEVPALVSCELFQAVAEQLAKNKSHHGRPAGAGRYLLQGLVVCSGCGYGYYGKQVGRRDHRTCYYRCGGSDASRFEGVRICTNKMVRGDRLEATVWEDVRQLLLEPKRIEQEHERRLGSGTSPRRQSQATLKLIPKVKKRISRLCDMYECGHIDRDEFQTRIESAKQRLSELEAEAQSLKNQEAAELDLRLVIHRLEEFAEQVTDGLTQCDWPSRQAIIRALVKRVEIDQQEVRIVYRVYPVPFVEAPAGGVMRNCGVRYAAAPRLRIVVPRSTVANTKKRNFKTSDGGELERIDHR